jgi:hypothetical protein
LQGRNTDRQYAANERGFELVLCPNGFDVHKKNIS